MWRFTIERIRTFIVVAAVLLVIAIGVFLGVSRWRPAFNRRDIPRRLGIDIQQEANGVTYTQAHGGHTIFKIHASKVVQLRNNRATLHDVVIELYGKDGARMDRIEGVEFVYDQSSSVATAAGAVEIEMQRPTAGVQPVSSDGKPSTGPKTVAPGDRSSSMGSKKPSTPNPNDQILVKTSGITFNQQTGLVTTAQHVTFTTGQGSGSAMGASYDSDLGYLVLDRDVEMVTTNGSNPVTLHAAHAELNRDSQLCTLHQATAQTRSEQATAVDALISFRDDGSVERLNASHGLTVSTEAGSHLAAPTGAIEFTADNQPRHAHLEGGVQMDSTLTGRTAHATAPTMDLDFTTDGDLRHAHLERGVEMQSHEVQSQDPQNRNQTQPAQPVEIARTWQSPVADVDFRPAADGQVEPASLHGTEGVVITSETRRAGVAPVPSRLAADDLTALLGPGSSLTSMTGQGHASLEETAATGAHETATGDHLDARFNSAPQPPASQAKASPPRPPRPANSATTAAAPQLAQIQTAQLDGHVVLIDQPRAKPGAPGDRSSSLGSQSGAQSQPPLRATAGHALYEAGDANAPEQWLHLTINPRVTNGGMELTAEKVDVAQSSGDAFAHGNVKATWIAEKSTNENPSNTNGAAPQTVALGGSAPAHVVAAEAQLQQSSGEATFRGRARLWQEQNSVSAPVIVLNRQQQTLFAQASGAGEPVVSVFLSAEATPAAPQPAAASAPGVEKSSRPDGSSSTGSTHTPSVIRVRSGDLHYSATDRKATLRAAPLSNVITQTTSVDTISDQLELYLTPANAPQPAAPAPNAAAPSQVDRVVALGHVVLNSQGRRGTGSQLVYTAQTGNYVLTGTPSVPPLMTDPQRGKVTGESLIFNSRDDSVSIEGGAQATKTQTTTPR